MRKIRWHWQNLNEDRDGKIKGPGWQHGRAWLYIGEATIGAEWAPWKSFGASVGVGDDHVVSASLRTPAGAVFLSFDWWPASKWLDELAKQRGWITSDDCGEYSRELSVCIQNWTIWWTLWRNTHYWKSGDKRRGSWHPFGWPGERVDKPEVREERDVIIPMPERSYRGKAVREAGQIRSPRWPWLRETLTTVKIDMADGEQIPVPGKGENSWDCGENAILGQSSSAKTIEEAIGNLVASVLQTRRRYGGTNWVPEKKAEAV